MNKNHPMSAGSEDSISEYSEDEDACSIPSRIVSSPASVHPIEAAVQPEFALSFCESNSFRGVTECLKILNPDPLSFIVKGNTVHIQHINKTAKAKVMVDIRLHKRFILEYVSPPADCHLMLSATDLYNVVRTTPRKDGLRIMKYPGDFQVYFSSLSQTSGRVGSNALRILESKPGVIQVLPSYTGGKSNPRHKFPALDFAKFCSTICGLKCLNMIIKLYANGTAFTGITKSGTIAKNLIFGDVPRDGPEASDCAFATIPIETVRSWGKLHGITGSTASGGVIRFYFEPKKPIMMELDVGHYGTMSIIVCE